MKISIMNLKMGRWIITIICKRTPSASERSESENVGRVTEPRRSEDNNRSKIVRRPRRIVFAISEARNCCFSRTLTRLASRRPWLWRCRRWRDLIVAVIINAFRSLWCWRTMGKIRYAHEWKMYLACAKVMGWEFEFWVVRDLCV